MKRFYLILILAAAVFSGCTGCSGYRDVVISIPQHPWECLDSVWYVLECSDSGRTLLIGPGENSVAYAVPIGKTVAFALYPFGDYSPLGGVRQDGDGVFIELSFEQGPLAEMFIRAEKEKAGCTSRLDFRSIYAIILKKCGDAFSFNRTELLLDMINGEVRSASVKKLKKCKISEFYLPNGTWIPESRSMNVFSSDEGVLLPGRSFPPGRWCWRDKDSRLEYRIVVDEACEGSMQRLKKY